LKDLDQKLSAFVDDFAGRPIHEITTPELDRWIRSLNVSGSTRNSYKRVLGVLFGFAVRMEYSLKNPARGIDAAPLFESGNAGGGASILATGSLSRAMRSA
jgi:hypothetical protein